jgi:hypothetical protein
MVCSRLLRSSGDKVTLEVTEVLDHYGKIVRLIVIHNTPAY